MKGKHSLRLLAIYSLNEQNQRTKARSRRGKRTGVFYWLWRERKSITPWKRFELHCDYTFNAEYFVIHEVPVFIVRSPPCWINFYVYLSPISIFSLFTINSCHGLHPWDSCLVFVMTTDRDIGLEDNYFISSLPSVLLHLNINHTFQ